MCTNPFNVLDEIKRRESLQFDQTQPISQPVSMITPAYPIDPLCHNFPPMPTSNPNSSPYNKSKSSLNKEELAELNNEDNSLNPWNITISRTASLKSKCNHRNQLGLIELFDAGNGFVKCKICGATFSMDTLSQEDVEDTIYKTIYILQQLKTFWMQSCDEYGDSMDIIAKLQKVPDLYQEALDQFKESSFK